VKYARPERERRFILEVVPPAALDERVIVDRYIRGTRLRLRCVRDASGEAVLKLGQKVRSEGDDPRLVWHTSLYLTVAEFDALGAVPADVLAKRRRFVSLDSGIHMAVDAFEGALAGLVLGEVDFPDEAAAKSFVPPAWTTTEVSRDERFTGGALATTDRAAIRRAVAEVAGPLLAERLFGSSEAG
jgi:CYTH domain-containing protein